MKKILILSIIIISTSMLTGCNEKTNKIETHKIDSNTIEYKADSNIVDDTSNQVSNIIDETSNSNVTSNTTKTSNTTVKSNTTSNKKSNTTSNKTSNNNYIVTNTSSYDDFSGNHIVFREYSIGNGEVFAVLTAYNSNNIPNVCGLRLIN